MLIIDRIIYAAVFFALGWFANRYRERRATPRKRGKAIPQGTAAERKPRVRKARPEPLAPSVALPMD